MTATYMVRYHEVDPRDKIVWDHTMYQEEATGPEDALERARDFLTWDEHRDITTGPYCDDLMMTGSIDGIRDIVALIYRKDI